MTAQRDGEHKGRWTPHDLHAWVAQADGRLRARLDMEAAELALGDAHRIDARMRMLLDRQGRGAAIAIEATMRRHVLRLLADQMTAARVEALLRPVAAVPERLAAAGLLRDPELLAELSARSRQDLLAAALGVAPAGPDEPSLLVRLSLAPDAPVARAANALLAADSRRRDGFERGAFDGSDLPPAIYGRLTWWVAAAMRGAMYDAARDRALGEAASRCQGAHDEAERSDALAMRLAAAIDPRPAEIASLLVEAIGDRRPGFFAALLAHALGLPFDTARAILLEPEGERLWLCLRALKLDRAAIARIGLPLAEADPARDLDGFADLLDPLMALAPEEAHAALEPMTLDPRFQAAMRSLDHPWAPGGHR